MRHEIERASLRIGAALLTCWAALGSMAEPSASRGCGAEPPAKPGTSAAFGLTSGGLDREYRLHLPPSYVADRPMSLMLDFHGYTGDAAGEEAYTGLSDHADEHGYIVVYPQGTGFRDQSDRLITSWNDLAGSRPAGPEGPICAEGADFYPHPPECGEPTRCTWATCHDDVGFIEALLDHLEEALCLDLDRVYATGMSNGGMFVHRLGCELPERFAAIAPVAGTLARGLACAPSGATPISMLNIWGRRDHYVSQERATSTDGYHYTSADVVLKAWADPSSQTCRSERTTYETPQDGKLGFECTQHDGCATLAEVVHCTWDGEHDWPQKDELRPGNDIIWEFFAKNPSSGYRPSTERGGESTP